MKRDRITERTVRGDLHVKEARNRIPKVKQADFFISEEQEALWHRFELFPTPPWAVRAAIETLGTVIDLADRDWYEPCAGLGHMVEPMIDMGLIVYASDIYDHGKGYRIADALTEKPDTRPGSIMFTNPPFSGEEGELAEKIVRHWQQHVDDVAIVCRQSFLNTVGRYELHHRNPIGNLTTLMPYSERVPMHLGQYKPGGKTATEYCVYHYRRGYTGRATVVPIPPGSRDRHFRPSDVTISPAL